MLLIFDNCHPNCHHNCIVTLSADNEITVFPPDLPECRLLCEMNPLVEEVPVGAIKEDQPLALGEIAARMVMNWSRKNDTLEKLLKEFPALQSSGRCYICGNNFLSVWLECVKFANVETAGLIRNVFQNDLVRIFESLNYDWIRARSNKRVKPKTHVSCTTKRLPIKGFLCSYKCFNQTGHNYYGLAISQSRKELITQACQRKPIIHR